jgi:hypothetical protein
MSTPKTEIKVMYIKHSVKFYLNSRFISDGKHKIYGRIIHKRKKSEFATNLWIEPEKWNQELQVAIKSPVVSRELKKIETEISDTVSATSVSIFLSCRFTTGDFIATCNS